MNNIDTQFNALVKKILDTGFRKENRTGVAAYTIAGATIEHDMSEGFPLLTCKKVPYKIVKVELEGFLKGVTSKKWFQDRGCTIWDEWCNPEKVPYGTDEATQKKMLEEDDLGPIYGSQWRNFNSQHELGTGNAAHDQVKMIVDKLKNNPADRRMICNAWNPQQLHQMALPPCHIMWQVTIIGDKLNLAWYQRSCDVFLGVPFNIASYATLLHLLAVQSGFKEGKLLGFLMDTHIYENHIDQCNELVSREPRALPKISTGSPMSIFDWEYSDTTLEGYDPHPAIKAPIAV